MPSYTIRATDKETGEVRLMKVQAGTPMTEVIKQYAALSGIDEAECRFLVGGKPLKTDKPLDEQVALTATQPPPSADDVAKRGRRKPMSNYRAEMGALLRDHFGAGIALVVVAYTRRSARLASPRLASDCEAARWRCLGERDTVSGPSGGPRRRETRRNGR